MDAVKVVFSLLVAMCTAVSANGQKDNYDFVYQDGWWKVVDTHGKSIVDSVYNMSAPVGEKGSPCVSEGKVVFVKNNKYGFKTLNGKVIVPAIYDEVTRFKDGLARVGVKTIRKFPYSGFAAEHWGLVNSKGQLVADTIHDYASDLDNEGMAILVKRDKLGLINKKGKLISPFVYETDEWVFSKFTFAYGLMPVLFFKGDEYSKFQSSIKVGFLNRSGKLVIDTVWDLHPALGNSDDDEHNSRKKMCGFRTDQTFRKSFHKRWAAASILCEARILFI